MKRFPTQMWLGIIAILLLSFIIAIRAEAYTYSGSSGARSFSVPARSYSAPSVRTYTPSPKTYSAPARTYTAPKVTAPKITDPKPLIRQDRTLGTPAPQVTQTVVREYGYSPFSSNFILWYWIFNGNKQSKTIINNITATSTTATTTNNGTN